MRSCFFVLSRFAMIITKIEVQKKNKNRMSVFLDGAFAFGIDAFSLYKLKLQEHDEIDAATLQEIKNTVLYEDAKAYAAKLLSVRSYTERDMHRKLKDRTGSGFVADKTVAFLKEYKLIDDAEYARRYASDCLRLKKLGRDGMKRKLLEKGIDRQLAEQVIEALNCQEEEAENLEALMRKKLAGDFSLKNRMKAKRYFASKGYRFDDIDTTLKKLTAQEEDGSSC